MSGTDRTIEYMVEYLNQNGIHVTKGRKTPEPPVVVRENDEDELDRVFWNGAGWGAAITGAVAALIALFFSGGAFLLILMAVCIGLLVMGYVTGQFDGR